MSCTQEYCSCVECVERWRHDREFCRRSTDSPGSDVQPAPVTNACTPIADLVRADLDARVALGAQRYGTKLQAHNGRDALMDAYQEAIDLVFYLRQAIAERDDRNHEAERDSILHRASNLDDMRRWDRGGDQ